MKCKGHLWFFLMCRWKIIEIGIILFFRINLIHLKLVNRQLIKVDIILYSKRINFLKLFILFIHKIIKILKISWLFSIRYNFLLLWTYIFLLFFWWFISSFLAVIIYIFNHLRKIIKTIELTLWLLSILLLWLSKLSNKICIPYRSLIFKINSIWICITFRGNAFFIKRRNGLFLCTFKLILIGWWFRTIKLSIRIVRDLWHLLKIIFN